MAFKIAGYYATQLEHQKKTTLRAINVNERLIRGGKNRP